MCELLDLHDREMYELTNSEFQLRIVLNLGYRAAGSNHWEVNIQAHGELNCLSFSGLKSDRKVFFAGQGGQAHFVSTL